MSKADKMFEELGYKKQEGLREINYYCGNNEIIFYKSFKWFGCSKQEEIDFMNMQELKAISEKCKELRMDGGIEYGRYKSWRLCKNRMGRHRKNN